VRTADELEKRDGATRFANESAAGVWPRSMGDASNRDEQRIVGRPFPKGASGNPRGRPRNGLGALIRATSQEGQELKDFAFAVLRGHLSMLDRNGHPILDPYGNPVPSDEQPSVKERMMALQWLGERGWGKPEEYRPAEGRARIDPSKLSELEAEQLLHLVEVAAVKEPVTVDAEADVVEAAKDATPKEEQ
jgi:hypothetical protein